MSRIPDKLDTALRRLSLMEHQAYYSLVLGVFRWEPFAARHMIDGKAPAPAAVELVKGQWIYLLYDPEALERFSVEEWMFILAHEGGHLLLEHLGLERDNPDAWYIAQEAAINERVQQGGVGTMPPNLVTVDWVNQQFNTSIDKSATDDEIYTAIKHLIPKRQQMVLVESQPCGGCSAHGDEKDEAGDGTGDGVDAALDGLVNRVKVTISDAANATGADVSEAQKTWGSSAFGVPRGYEEEEPYRVPWEDLLRNAVAMRVEERRRAAYSVKTGHWNDRMPLVAWKEEPDPDVVCYIDLSGSIDQETANRFYSTMMSFSKPTYYTFDHDIYPEGERDFRGGGGTNFQQLEDHDEFGAASMLQYPDVVVVLTDGYAPAPDVSHPDKWIWVICPNGTEVEGAGLNIQVE